MRDKSMKVSYDVLRNVAEDFYNYQHTLSEFRCFGYDDGSRIVEINELGKNPKRLKITVLVEELPKLKEYLDTENNYALIQDTHKRNDFWLEIPEGAEVLTGLKSDQFSQVFWKPSLGEVYSENRFATYSFHNSISYEEYIDRWISNPILWERVSK